MPADPIPSTPPMLGGLEAVLPEAERAGFERLRQAWHARLRPLDEAERATVDGLVAQVWRARRLDALEERVMARLMRLEPVPAACAPSLVLRARARLDKDRKEILQELELARLARPKPLPMPDLNPERLEWLARHLRRRQARAEAEGLAAGLENLDPDPRGAEVPSAEAPVEAGRPRATGTPEPAPAAEPEAGPRPVAAVAPKASAGRPGAPAPGGAAPGGAAPTATFVRHPASPRPPASRPPGIERPTPPPVVAAPPPAA